MFRDPLPFMCLSNNPLLAQILLLDLVWNVDGNLGLGKCFLSRKTEMFWVFCGHIVMIRK